MSESSDPNTEIERLLETLESKENQISGLEMDLVEAREKLDDALDLIDRARDVKALARRAGEAEVAYKLKIVENDRLKSQIDTLDATIEDLEEEIRALHSEGSKEALHSKIIALRDQQSFDHEMIRELHKEQDRLDSALKAQISLRERDKELIAELKAFKASIVPNPISIEQQVHEEAAW